MPDPRSRGEGSGTALSRGGGRARKCYCCGAVIAGGQDGYSIVHGARKNDALILGWLCNDHGAELMQALNALKKALDSRRARSE